MKRTLAVVFILALGMLSVFGYSLRMDTMGRVLYAIEDFESDVERNPANIAGLEENYFRLTFGMDAGAFNLDTSYDGITSGSWYGTDTQEMTYSGMPISVLGFYKFGMFALGFNFDMPKETFENITTREEREHDGTNYYTRNRERAIESSITNFALTVGANVSNFDAGFNFGQNKGTATFSDVSHESGSSVWDNDWWEVENEATYESTFYGFGAKYPTGKMVFEFAYKMASLTAEMEATKDIDYDGFSDVLTVNDVSDRDNYPLEVLTLDSSLIHLKGKYSYTEDIDAAFAVDIIVHNAEPTSQFATIPDYKQADVTVNQTNVSFGIGYNKDKYKFGLEMNYNMFDVTFEGYGVLDWLAMTTWKASETTATAKLLVWKAGTEFIATDKLTLRAGAIKYAPLSAEIENTNFNTDGIATYHSTQTLEKLNSANLILASVGLEYKFTNQISLEYGYLGGKYLYNQNTLALVSDLGAYGGALMNNITMFCLLYTSPSPRDRTRSRMPSSA